MNKRKLKGEKMSDILKLALSVYLFSLSASALSGIVRFIADIRKFKDKEESFQTEKEFEQSIIEADKEGGENYDRESSEYDSPIIF